MAKGKATATFLVGAEVSDGIVTITIEADALGNDVEFFTQTVNGTVALGKAVAELGKYGNVPTAGERRLAAAMGKLIGAGHTEDEANAIIALLG